MGNGFRTGIAVESVDCECGAVRAMKGSVIQERVRIYLIMKCSKELMLQEAMLDHTGLEQRRMYLDAVPG
jgi:hypothetical protein